MATTADYLNKLVTQKNTLADNLVTKGVTATHDETLETLVPKVLDISSGGEGNGIYPVGEDSRPTGDVIVPEGVVSLYQYIFYQNANVTSVKLPDTLTTLSANCFQQCANLERINIPTNVNTISAYAFHSCSSLKNVTLSKNVTNIADYAFYGCLNLCSLDLPQDISFNVGNYAFRNSGITGDGVNNILKHTTSIGVCAFQSCLSVDNVEITKTSNTMFRDCTNLITAVFKDITSIERAIFYGCTSLKTVYLPSTITSDYYSSLSTTVSAYYVFYGCDAIEDVQLGQDWNMSLRLDVSNNITIDSMIAMFNSLKDLTGETAKTLTLGEINLAKLTDEQKAIATNKNWTLA